MRKHRLHIRITKEEFLELERRAKKAGLTRSDYVRKVALNSSQKFLTNSDRELFNELRIELRNTANLRNKNASLRTTLDPIRKQLKNLIRQFQ
jgi:hypothetical protein